MGQNRKILEVRYPRVDRSHYKLNFEKRDSDDHIDLGFAEGIFSDGRPFRAECWAAYQHTFLTFYFSSNDIENMTNKDLKEYLKSEHAVEFLDDKYAASGFTGINVDSRKKVDASDREIWEVTVTVGDEDGTYIKRSVSLQRYRE